MKDYLDKPTMERYEDFRICRSCGQPRYLHCEKRCEFVASNRWEMHLSSLKHLAWMAAHQAAREARDEMYARQ